MLNLRFTLLLPLLMFVNLHHYQTIISGIVIDKKTSEPLPYITVNLKSERIYSRSDENGVFKIHSIKNNPNDTLIFTCIGYLQAKIPVSDIKSGAKVALQEDVQQLNEVTISSREMILGAYTNTGYMPYRGTSMMTRRFRKNEDYTYLKRVAFRRKTDKFSGNGKAQFRITIYNSEDNYGPPNDVVYEQILVDDSQDAELIIDLTKYHILLPSNYFFIGIERITAIDAKQQEPRVLVTTDTQYSWVKLFGSTIWEKIYVKPAITATVM